MIIRSDQTLRLAIYGVYVALFNARLQCPDGFLDRDMTRLLTGLMSAKEWSWRVIGITPEALEVFAEHDFKRPAGKLQRGHQVDRVVTARELFQREKPENIDEFFHTFLKNDQTVLMTNQQNRHRKVASVPQYIPIDNNEATLFPSGTLVGWKHRKVEVDFLRQLHLDRTRTKAT